MQCAASYCHCFCLEMQRLQIDSQAMESVPLMLRLGMQEKQVNSHAAQRVLWNTQRLQAHSSACRALASQEVCKCQKCCIACTDT